MLIYVFKMINSSQKKILIFFLFTGSILGYAQSNKTIANLVFEKTNELRKEKGLKPFKKLDSLDFLAQYHSDNMVKKKFYAHTDHNGLNPVERAEKYNIQAWRRVGNKYIGIAENIGQVPWFENVSKCGDTRSNEAIAECFVQGWKNSPPHYKNILSDYIYLGVGISFNSKKVGFATQNFR